MGAVRATVTRKQKIFRADPKMAVMSVWNRDIRPRPAGERAWVQTLAKRRLRRAGALEALERFVAARPASAFSPDYCDLIYLHSRVRKLHPEVVVEFGSGCSTVVLAHALAKNGSGVLHTVEADEQWLKATVDAFPADLQSFCRMTYSPALECERFGLRGFRHEQLPDVRADLIYVDGPALTPQCPVAFDVFDVGLAPGAVIVVDGRPQQAQLISRELETRRAFKRPGYFTYVFAR